MLLPLLLTSLGAPAAHPVAASPNYLLALAPEGAVSVLAVGNLDELREVARKNSYLRFGRDEEVAALVDHFAAQAMKNVASGFDLEALMGQDVDLAEFMSSLHGSVVFFSELPDNNPEQTLAGLMIELGEDRSGFDQLFSRLLERMGDEASISGSEYGGVPLTTIVPRDQWNKGALLVAELGDAVVLMGGAGSQGCRDELEGIIDRWTGASSTGGLLQSDRFRQGRGSLDFLPSVEFHLDLGAFWNALRASGELAGQDIPEVLLDEIGGIRWLHGGGRIGEGEELDLQLGVAMPEDGLLASFRGLFGGVPVDLLRHVPRQATRVSSLSLDVHGLFTMMADMLRSLDEHGYEELEQGLASIRELGVDLESDFLGQLTGEFASFSVEVPSNESLLGMAGAMVGTANGDEPTPTFACGALIGLRERETIESAVNRLIATSGPELVTARLVEGHELQSLSALGFLSLNWAFTPNSLALSMQPTPLVEALRMGQGDAPSIMDKGRFSKRIQAHRAATHFAIWDTATNLKAILGGLQKVSRMLPLISAFTGTKLPRDFPIGADTPWPSPSIVGRYFEGTILSALTWDEHSLRFAISAQ